MTCDQSLSHHLSTTTADLNPPETPNCPVIHRAPGRTKEGQEGHPAEPHNEKGCTLSSTSEVYCNKNESNNNNINSSSSSLDILSLPV